MIQSRQLLAGILMSAAASTALLVPPQTVAAAPTKASEAAAAVDDAGTFLDTFADAPNTGPSFGLNAGLAARQTGTARSPYTRVSGSWRSGALPPDASAVQVNHPRFPDRLSFWAGPSAVMLDAPARADDTGRYTVTTTIDPAAGEANSADWAALAFSRSRASAGYVTNVDIDLGLTVGSNGSLALYSAGQLFWNAGVPPTDAYAVAITVSTGADRTVTLVVNDRVFTAVAPGSVTRWPSTPYVYLGAYLSDPGHPTTFGSGRPGEGLAVSQVDAGVIAHSRLFADTFDGASDTDPTGYGLNDSLRGRQPATVTSRYLRRPGSSPDGSLPAWISQVNHPAYPNSLSFWVRPSAARLEKPVAASLDGSYSVSVVVDPAGSGGGSGSWGSVMLSALGNARGAPSSVETDLGLVVTDSGRLQLYQRGTPTWSAQPVVPSRPDGRFAVTVAVLGGAAKQVRIDVNGQVFTASTAAQPALTHLFLGANVTGNAVTTFDDLRVSGLSGLNYYGYFDVQDPTDHVDHAPEVGAYTNLNLYLDPPPAARLDYCRPRECMINIQWQQFTVASDGTMVLRPDSLSQVAALRAEVGELVGKLGAIYLVDEPYASGRRVSAADLQTATDQVRAIFGAIPLVLALDSGSVNTNDRKAIPANIDMVGFTAYCRTDAYLRSTLAALTTRITTRQQLFLVPESAANKRWCPNTSDAGIAATQATYRAIAADNARVVYLMNFGWWLGTYEEGGERAGEADPFANLPQTAAAQRAIGASVVNPN